MSRIERALERAVNEKSETPVSAENADNGKTRPRVNPAGGNSKLRSDYSAFEGIPRPPIPNPYMITATDPRSPISEQYRKLKSLLVKMTRNDNENKNSLLVTSTVGGEGKTITALNLGITLAQEYDHTVLLVEADLRRPTIMSYLGLEAKRGLSDCVLDGVDVGSVLVKTGIGKLVVLPAGRAVEDPVEIFNSSRMKEIISEIKSRYSDRFVIIDSTPLLPFAEGYILASMVDSTLFVARQDYTPFEKLKEALASLKTNNVLGVICNDVDGRSLTGNGYYGYYGYYNYHRK